MSKIKNSVIVILMILLLSACDKKESFKINDEVLLTGTIQVKEIMKEGEKTKVTYLELEHAITINDKTINKIELNTDQELKENTKTTIKGKIEDSGNLSILDLDYIFSVTDIENVLSYVNTFGNDDFSFSIPSNLIKQCTVKEIENGFIVFSKNNMDVGGEVLTIKSVTPAEYKILQDNEQYIEKVKSDRNKIIVITYPMTNQFKDEYKEEYEQIGNQIGNIKKTVTIK